MSVLARRPALRLSLLACGVGLAHYHYVAQAAPLVLEEVLVTAQKRTENVQDIPLTINVVDASTIDDFSIRTTTDLADSVPGLVIQHTPQNLAQVTIRGLGTGSASESLDQSVGLFIDGIWTGRIREFQASLFDLERVEVIKGTQNTLLGKNTSLGALSIVSVRPGEELAGYLQADYETVFGSVYTTGAVDLPSALGNYRLAFNQVDEAGYVDNLTTGNEVPAREQSTLRLGANFTLGGSGELYASYQYDDLRIRGDAFQPDQDQLGFMQGMDPGADIGLDQHKHAYTSYGSSGDADDEQTTHRATLHYQQGLGDMTFTSFSGWSEYDNDRLTDTDFLSVDYLTSVFASDYEQFTQEFRIASPVGERFDYLLGVYYHDSSLEYANITDAAFPPPYTLGPLPVDSASLKTYDQDTTVLAGFGQLRLYLDSAWQLDLGLRYTDEDKDAVWGRQRLRSGGPLADILADVVAPVVAPTELARSEHNLDGSASLQYDVSSELTGYISWARGSKSGGFTNDVAVPEEAEFATEEAETTELGLKWQLADGAGLLNAALFNTDIDDFQVVSFIGTGFLTSTVPARSRGLELETRWLLGPALVLGASATYADAEETDTGLRLPYAPEWSASVDAAWTLPIPGSALQWRLEGAINYRDEQFQQRGETSPDGALTLVDLRLAVAAAAGDWELALVGRNLLDESSSFGFDFPYFGGQLVPAGTTTIGSVSRPRTFALQGRYRF
ncbi:TonB-dependent receptor [Seongchinamella sediminis]|uniref:TonB-dependent receptor n=1 Tax=Seongchinamella sediminis TaxID=2283635 RepID=A0A3L7DUT3_9GAMM|nr:TonB-dependent receptor [Seongchinamella sediminis]RLQ20876.1 TonB-dependent receptor [Seongchinamella sediminis]